MAVKSKLPRQSHGRRKSIPLSASRREPVTKASFVQTSCNMLGKQKVKQLGELMGRGCWEGVMDEGGSSRHSSRTVLSLQTLGKGLWRESDPLWLCQHLERQHLTMGRETQSSCRKLKKGWPLYFPVKFEGEKGVGPDSWPPTSLGWIYS